MQAWSLEQAFGAENLELVHRSDPQPGPHQVLVRVLAASLNHRDLVVLDGQHGSAVKPPVIPVSDGVGVVEEVGAAVDGLTKGRRVCPLFFQNWFAGDPPPDLYRHALGGPLDGMIASTRVFDAASVVPIPDEISDLAAAALPCAGLTAWSALTEPRPAVPGDTVLVQGTGGVALFAVQFARLMGARVIATTSEPARFDLLRSLGADEVIDYRADPEWHKSVKAMTGGQGCDRVIELGGAETLERSLRAARIGGLVILIGNVTGSVATISLPLILTRRITLHAVTVGHKQGFERMVRAMASAGIEPVIDHVYGFAEAPDAFAALRAGGHTGKICIDVNA